MGGDKVHLLQVIHEARQRRKTTLVDKLWLAALFVGLGLLIGSVVMLFVTFFDPLWEAMTQAILFGMVAIAASYLAYSVWKLWHISKAVKAREAAGIPRDPPTPEDEFHLVYMGLGLPLIVGGTVVGFIFLRGWGPLVAMYMPGLALLGATWWLFGAAETVGVMRCRMLGAETAT